LWWGLRFLPHRIIQRTSIFILIFAGVFNNNGYKSIIYTNIEEGEMKMIRLELRGKIFDVDRDILMNVSGTYFSGMLSSGAWQPNSHRVYAIDRPSERFD
jgi:hypothetical protein